MYIHLHCYVLLLISQVKFGQHKRYQEWFQKKVSIYHNRYIHVVTHSLTPSSPLPSPPLLPVSLHSREPASDSRAGAVRVLCDSSSQRDPAVRHRASLGPGRLAALSLPGAATTLLLPSQIFYIILLLLLCMYYILLIMYKILSTLHRGVQWFWPVLSWLCSMTGWPTNQNWTT